MPGVILELSLTQPKIKITEGTRRAERASGESREEEVSVVNETHGGDLEVELLIPPLPSPTPPSMRTNCCKFTEGSVETTMWIS